jgi:hypothetical protein
MLLDPVTSESHWLARLQAVGKMQARYLWFLVVACSFYGGLASGALRPADGNAVKVPVLNLELDSAPILTTGTLALSFLVLVIIGTLKAYRFASEQLGATKLLELGEATDVEPNFLDMAFYSGKWAKTPRPPILESVNSPWFAKWWRVMGHLTQLLGLIKYPALLTLALVEAAWLWWKVSRSILARFTELHAASSFVVIVSIVGGVVWIIACGQVLWYWKRRFADWI